MGLDQYLTASRYIGDWYHYRHSERARYLRVCEAVGLKGFVDNVQDGKDDCGRYEVSREQLNELRNLCTEVLASTSLKDGIVQNGTIYTQNSIARNFQDGQIMTDPSKAIELLPVQSGFFFGSTDYDQWYVKNLKNTVEQLDKALAIFGDEWDFEYRATW